MPSKSPATIVNPSGRSSIVFICDHASNYIPDHYDNLGLEAHHINDHIGWDIGAAELTKSLSYLMDAPAVLAGFSRLLIDCNRHIEAHDLIPPISDKIEISGNLQLTASERIARIEQFHEPFHQAVSTLLDSTAHTARTVIAIHSFTPRMNGFDRPWHMGLLFEEESDLIAALARHCAAFPEMVVGMNAPYDPQDGTYYTMARHAKPRGLSHAMIEVRNDQLRTQAGIETWAKKLAHIISEAHLSLED